MDANGSNVTRLTNEPQNDDSPAFSPDGLKIFFESTRLNVNNPDIFVMDANGANQTRLTSGLVMAQHPGVSYDGTQVAFESPSTGVLDIYVMNANGSNVINVCNNTTTDVKPFFGRVQE